MADWLSLYDEYAGDAEIHLICLLESIGHCADDVLREPVYTYSEDTRPYDEDALVQAIEDENEPQAIALLRGALAAGLHFRDIERSLSRAALLHYADFGHSLIYVAKAGRLIARLGETIELPLLLALVRSLVFAWREDKIPEFRAYATAPADWNRPSRPQTTTPTIEDYRRLAVDKALGLTVAAGSAPPEESDDDIGSDTRRLLAMAINRFLHSPIKRKHVRRTAHQAIKFVAKDG